MFFRVELGFSNFWILLESSMESLMESVLTPAIEWAKPKGGDEHSGEMDIARRFQFVLGDESFLLGRGGYGAVYRGKMPGSDRQVAVKLFSAEKAGHPFLREVRAWDRLRALQGHATIPEILDVGATADGGSAFIATELLHGATLREMQQEKDALRLSIRSRLIVIAWVVDGLKFLGENGLVHRDIKPENIFVQSTPRTPKIIDFGTLALVRSGGEGETPMRRAEDRSQPIALRNQTHCEGTPYYLAPEACRREAVPASDVFSAGVVLLEMLGGVVLGPSKNEDLLKVRMQDAVGFVVPRLNEHFTQGLVPEVEVLLSGLLEARPEARWTAERTFHSLMKIVTAMPEGE